MHTFRKLPTTSPNTAKNVPMRTGGTWFERHHPAVEPVGLAVGVQDGPAHVAGACELGPVRGRAPVLGHEGIDHLLEQLDLIARHIVEPFAEVAV